MMHMGWRCLGCGRTFDMEDGDQLLSHQSTRPSGYQIRSPGVYHRQDADLLCGPIETVVDLGLPLMPQGGSFVGRNRVLR